MLGDILSINEMHNMAGDAIAKRVLSERGKKPKFYKFIVGISGESGTGKSEVAHSLALKLKQEHIRVKILQTDNYYKVPPLLRLEWRRTKGIESVGMDEYDWNLIHRNIQDFKEERESMLPCTDIIPEQVDKLITDFKKIDLIILDGLYSIKADGIDLRVFIDITWKDNRDLETNVNQADISGFQMQIIEKEHLNSRALKPLADLIISKTYQVTDAKTGENL